MAFGNFNAQDFVIGLIVLVLSITLHEFGHALSADRLGDPGPRRAGRVNIWPDRHFDLLGFTMMVFTLIAGFGLGWGKPVQVNSRCFRNPRQGMLITAVCGPLMNLLIALVAGLTLRFAVATGHIAWMTNDQGGSSVSFQFALEFLSINLSLMFFNLIPIHPLDGSKVLSALLPEEQAYRYDRTVGQYSPYIMLLIFVFGGHILAPILGPAVRYAASIIIGTGL